MQIIQFIEYIKYEKRYSLHTVTAYANNLNEFQDFLIKTEGDFDIADANKTQIRNFVIYLSEKKNQAITINRKISALKGFFKYLVRKKIIEKSPLSNFKSLKTSKKVQLPFSENEMNQVVQTYESNSKLGLQEKLIIELFYQAGLRKSELIELKTKDIDFVNNTLKIVGKRNKERMVPISKNLKEEIEFFISRKENENLLDQFLFTRKNGEKLYPKQVYNIVIKHFRKISQKKKISPHILRHSFATHILNKGAEINSVKELLGHSSLASTQVYTHQNIENLKIIFNQSHPREKIKSN